ncbi:MAG: tRNA-specific adenosine deaminase [Rickettsiales bacterium]|nr:MAG: tRNA-specific adenosine deaminase [Rickettsiales bacterium]
MKLTTLSESNFNNKFMRAALIEAEKAYAAGEIPVGCVIVCKDTGQIIARAHNIMQKNNNPNMHAEIIAINHACGQLGNKSLSNCDLYVTLEPCTMCASAISNARLACLYYGASDPKQGAVEHGVRFYTSNSCFHRPEIYYGLYCEESEELMKGFFSQLRKSKI